MPRKKKQSSEAAVRAAYPGDALVEGAAVEVAMDRRLDVATQVAVSVAEALFVDVEETLEMVSEGPVQDGALGVASAIDTRARSCGDRLHPEGRMCRSCQRAADTTGAANRAHALRRTEDGALRDTAPSHRARAHPALGRHAPATGCSVHA